MNEWKTLIDRRVKVISVSKWRMAMERKVTLNWHKIKKAPKSELFYDESWAGQLLSKANKSLEVNV